MAQGWTSPRRVPQRAFSTEHPAKFIVRCFWSASMRRGNGRTLITGASAGIGLELSREFARHGHPVILMARNEPRLKEIATQLNQAHHVKVTEHLKNLAPLQRLGEP